MRINRLQNALNGLVLHLGRLLSKLKRPYANHILPRCRLEPQLDLPLRLRLPGYLKNTQRKHKTPGSKGNIHTPNYEKNKRTKKQKSDRMRDLGVVYETVAGPGIGWQLAGTGVLQALDDGLRKMRSDGNINNNNNNDDDDDIIINVNININININIIINNNNNKTAVHAGYRFAGAVGADDEGKGFEEGDDVLVLGVEAADALDEHLVHRAHLSSFASSTTARV